MYDSTLIADGADWFIASFVADTDCIDAVGVDLDSTFALDIRYELNDEATAV